MDQIEQILANWKNSLLPSLSRGGMFSRNPTAHRWKAPFRGWMLRETVMWRAHDLLTQSYELHKLGHALGARILLRSALETVATLIYLNRLMAQVVDGKLDFHLFSDKTETLLLGRRNNTEGPKSLNIVTVLQKCEAAYPGIEKLYADLSESAHPSMEGLMLGYSKNDRDADEVNFSNRWQAQYGGRHPDAMLMCLGLLEHEYNNVSPALIEKMESWIEANNTALESTKNDPAKQG